jgi:hypothetical protein
MDTACSSFTASDAPRACKVAGFTEGVIDSRGQTVEEVYFKRAHYAIYLARHQVVIQYADEEDLAKQQIDLTAELIPLRDKLRFMVEGRHVKGCYRGHIADAFRLALEGKPLVAQEILSCAIEDILGHKARVGRTNYMLFAGPVALAVFVVLATAGTLAWRNDAFAAGRLLLALSGGTMGALLSIAIALRTRTVAVDDDRKANWLDAAIRLIIGTISGGALLLALVTGVVASISMVVVKDENPDLAWQAALIIGFAAGFFERLVPDLLAKSFESKPKVTSSAAGQRAT